MSRIKIFFFLLSCVSFSLFAGDTFCERLNYKIVLPENPSAVRKFAASELKSFLEKNYSEKIKLNESDAPVSFYVGISGDAVMAGFTDLPDLKGGFGVFRKGRNILFTGFDDIDVNPEKECFGKAGTLLSVYYFMGKYMGIKFYFPGDNGYSLSKNIPIKFDLDSDIPAPSFELRGFSLKSKEFTGLEMKVFFRRSLCSIPVWGRHELYYIFMYNWKKRFWKTNPEYFMMRDGKRVSGKYPLHIPCLSNPDVLKQTAADIVEKINAKPSIKTVRIFCDAPVYQCQCERCKASKERKLAGRDEGSGEEIYGFQKRVADVVHEAHPGTYFLTQTKMTSYQNPPTLIKLGNSFTVELLTRRHDVKPLLLDPSIELAKKWKKARVRTFLKSYPRYSDKHTKNLPVITPEFTSKYLKAFAGLTSGTKYSELNFNPYSFSALNQFVQARFLFDTNSDLEKVILEFCSFAYPGAEKEMLAFYREMERLYSMRGSVHSNPFLNIYYPGKLEKPMKLLEAARLKVKKESIWFDRLFSDFKKFYDISLEQKEKLDALRSKISPLLSLPFVEGAESFAGSFDFGKWKGALKKELMSPRPSESYQKSFAYIVCDEKYLYIGLKALEKNPETVKKDSKENHKCPVWSDDCFEIMLVDSKDKKEYFQIVVNSLGKYRILRKVIGKKHSDALNFKLDVRAESSNDSWSLILKIPLSQFAASDFKHEWLFDVFRNRPATEKRKNGEISGISIMSPSFHVLNEYCHLEWPKQISSE
jgi:hypothetical protein